MTDDILAPIYALDPGLVNRAIERKLGRSIFGVYGSYDNELGQRLIERALGDDVFVPGSVLDPELARAQINLAVFEADSDYVAQAVHFDGSAYLSTNSLIADATTQSLSVSFWFKGNNGGSWLSGGVLAVVDPDGAFDTFMEFTSAAISVFLGDSSGASFTESTGDMGSLDTNWHHCLFTGQSIGSPVDRMFIDGVDLGDITFIGQPPPFDMPFGGKKFVVGSDGLGTNITGDLADVWIAPGAYLIDDSGTIPAATVEKFIKDGKPQSPTSFPAGGAVLFSGDASSFVTNQGSGGPFVLNGTLTNASTSPSDDVVPYVASAVHADGTVRLVNEALTATDNGDFSASFWFKVGATDNDSTTLWVSDPDGDYANDLILKQRQVGFDLANPGAGGTMGCYFFPPPQLSAGWHHILLSMKTNLDNISKIATCYIDDVFTVLPLIDQGNTASFTQLWNGKKIAIFDDGFGDAVTGDFADMWIAPGVSLLTGGEETTASFVPDTNPNSVPGPYGQVGLVAGTAVLSVTSQADGADLSDQFETTISVNDQIQQLSPIDLVNAGISPVVTIAGGSTIPVATRRKFISAEGKPVNPTNFPSSAMLFSGGASSFGTNQGTGGAFTLAAGTLTAADSSPSS